MECISLYQPRALRSHPYACRKHSISQLGSSRLNRTCVTSSLIGRDGLVIKVFASLLKEGEAKRRAGARGCHLTKHIFPRPLLVRRKSSAKRCTPIFRLYRHPVTIELSQLI